MGAGTLWIVDSRAYANIQLKSETGKNQVHVYLEDKIQQSQTKCWQAYCENVPWTRGTRLFLFFSQQFFEAAFASNSCQCADRGAWVGSVKDHGRGRGFDNEVCIHTLQPNELVLKNTIFFTTLLEAWGCMLESLCSSEVLEKASFGKIRDTKDWLSDHPLSNNVSEPWRNWKRSQWHAHWH